MSDESEAENGVQRIFSSNLTYEHILKSLIVTDQNINMKTKISFPKELATFEAFGKECITSGYPKLGKAIAMVSKIFKELSVSQDGERAKGILKAIASINQNQQKQMDEFQTLFNRFNN